MSVGSIVACLTHGLKANVGVLDLKGEMTECARAEAVGGIGEDLKQTRAGVEHHAHTLTLAPFANDGQTEDAVVKIEQLVKVFKSLSLERNVMDTCNSWLHKTLQKMSLPHYNTGGAKNQYRKFFRIFKMLDFAARRWYN